MNLRRSTQIKESDFFEYMMFCVCIVLYIVQDTYIALCTGSIQDIPDAGRMCVCVCVLYYMYPPVVLVRT